MITIKTIQKLMPLTVLFILFACDRKVSSPGPDFSVRVIDHQGQPIQGAYIEGGFDWEYFRVATDRRGWATLPGYARGLRATIYKNNYFSIIKNGLIPNSYMLNPTPYIFTEIGEIEGTAIRFDSHQLLTITYQGEYHVYSYDDNAVSEIASSELPLVVRNFKLYGDTLWYAAYDDGIYVYSLADPLNPQQLFHLNISGILWPFARKDTIVAVGSFFSSGPLRVFSYNSEGAILELDSMENFLMAKMTFISDYVITLRNYSNLLTVFDLADPADIRLAFNGYYDGYETPFLYGDTIIITGDGNATSGTRGYQAIDLSNPEDPANTYAFTATGRIEEMVNDSTAVGRYYYHGDALCVFRRVSLTQFETIGIVSELGYREHGGCKPPYFIIGERLWKLEERD
jgi:hypothetical protein